MALTLLLAALLALLPGEARASPEAITLWHAYRGEEKAAIDALVERYNAAQTDARVEALAVPYDAFANKLEAAAPRGNGPDVFIAAHERVGSWVRSGLLRPVQLDAALYHPATLSALTWEDQLWAVPLSWKCVALFYNRALIAAPPEDSDALVTALQGFRQRDLYGLVYEAATPYYHAAWMHGFGGGIFRAGPTGSAVALDQPGNAESYAFVADLIARDLIPDEPTSALVTQLMNDGRAAMAINGPWFLGELSPSLDIGVAPLPVVSATGRRLSPLLTVEGAMVSAFSKHPEAARAFASWLASPEAAVVRATTGRQGVATLAAFEDPAVAGDPILSAFRAQLDHATPMSNHPDMAATWEPMARALRRVLRGAMTPQAAATQAQTEFRVVSKPPPDEVDPAPFWAAVTLLGLGGLAWVGSRAWLARAEMRRQAHAYAYVLPAALSMGLLVLAPFVVGAAVSLFEQVDGRFRFVGLANFLDILLSRDWPVTSSLSFYSVLLVTILWTAANVALHVGVGMALALILREPWIRLRAFWRVALILPWAVPNYITALIWKGMFNRQFGAINGLLGALGLEPVSWFSQFSTAFAANLTTNTWLGFPFMMVVTLGALQAIPRELEQAAELDGATGWQRFRHVTLPLLAPALLPAVVMGSVWTFNMFNIIYLVSGGEPDGSTEILISEAYKWAFTRGHRYGYAAAYAVLIFGVLLVYTRSTRYLLAKRGL